MNTDKYKTKLEDEKKLLEGELGSIGRLNTETNEWEAVPPEGVVGGEADENDLADKAENYEERSSTLRVLNGRLDDIKKALSKMENGSYGKCEVCGMQIEEARLEANPSAQTCEVCMEKVR
jgi:RNA polymerase-binding transcription factor DksA